MLNSGKEYSIFGFKMFTNGNQPYIRNWYFYTVVGWKVYFMKVNEVLSWDNENTVANRTCEVFPIFSPLDPIFCNNFWKISKVVRL